MNDVLFINPPNHCREDYIPLGLNNLYSIIKRAEYKTCFLDIQKMFISGELIFDIESLDKILDVLDRFDALIYAFTVWNTSFPWVISMCEHIKKRNSSAFIMIGGPLSTLIHEQIMNDYDFIDIACRYEGELIIEPIVRALLKNDYAALGEIGNITYRDQSGKIISNDDEKFMENLDELPFIELMPNDLMNRVINIEAGRGCSFHCYYCSSCFIWKFRPRYKSGSRLFSEMEKIFLKYKEAGMPTPVFHLEHDNFLMKPEILDELDERVSEKGLDLKYGFAGRADLITERNLELLKRTGCVYVYLGIETGSARMQKIIRKNLSLDKALSAILKVQNKGIIVNANIMYGFPEETLEDLFLSLDFINKLRWLGVKVHVSLLSPEMKTKVGEDASLLDYIYNEKSRYAVELMKSGFDPSAYREIYLNHLYTLRNSNYDILTWNSFVLFWHELVTFFPLTVFSIMQVETIDWHMIFSAWFSIQDHIDLKMDSKKSVFEFLSSFKDGFGQDSNDIRIAELEFEINVKAEMNRERMREYYEIYDRRRRELIERLGIIS